MIKLLIGGSPCTYWSIAQKNNRETEASGVGWELFKNYLIAKEKFQPDFFLYENNKSAAQAIKDQIKREFGVTDNQSDLLASDIGARYIEINSALVSAQNRQRFYVHNCGDVQQPENRGILLKDILESGTDLSQRDKSFYLTASYNGACGWNTIERSQRTMVAEPVGIGYRGRMNDGNWVKQYEAREDNKANALATAVTDSMCAEPINITSDGKAQVLKANYYKTSCANIFNGENGMKFAASGVAEPIRIPEYRGCDDKARPINAHYGNNVGCGEGSLEGRLLSDNPNKQQVDLIAHRVGAMPRPNGELSDSQSFRIYSSDNKSVTINSGGGGAGGKTGLYAVPIKTPEKPDGKQYPVHEVKDGKITIKGKQYPIKLKDGYYIIRKLSVTECCRLQTMPDDYCKAVSDTQAYKGLGNGWTAEVIIHILNSALKNVPKDEEIVVLSMYDGVGTGRYCLDKMGFTNVRYYAYEIDKYAMKIATSNYPDIIECGDAFKLRDDNWTLTGKEYRQ